MPWQGTQHRDRRFARQLRFELQILVFPDLKCREESIYTRANRGHALSAGFGAILIGFVGFSLRLGPQCLTLPIDHIGLYTLFITPLYLIGVQTVLRYGRDHVQEYMEQRAQRYEDITLRKASARYAGAAALVVGVGAWLSFVGVAL